MISVLQNMDFKLSLKTVEYEDSPDTVTLTPPLSHDLVASQLY